MKEMGYNKKIFSGFLIFGLLMGLIFPFFATMFVEVIEGRLLFFIVGCILAGIFVGVINYLIYRIFIGKVIQLLSHRFQTIAEGDLTVTDLHIKSNDDFGRLASSFNIMKQTLQELIGRIATSSNEAAKASDTLAVNANDTKNSVNAITKSIDEIASGTTMQSKYSSSIVDITYQTANEIKKGTEIATTTETIASEATSVAKIGQQAISEVISHLNILSDSVKKSTMSVQRLGNRSDEIGNIINIISSIAEKTNLLALNAAIEAARAGEEGKGFAVVADEVRKLAEQSKNSSTQISQLIRAIQSETNDTVALMEQNVEIVHKQVERINRGNKAFQKIVHHVQDTELSVEHIKQVFTSLEATSNECLKAVQHISTVINETATSASDVSAAAKKQSKAIVEITESSKNLSHISQQLQQEAHKFTV